MKPFKIWCETEKEKRAVLKKMERMGIRWANTAKPTYYMGDPDYKAPIGLYIDETGFITRNISKSKFLISKCYSTVSVCDYLCKSEKIIIYRDGQKVIALDKRTGEKAEARCNPSDTFDFNIGARIAFDRLIPDSEKDTATSESKGFTGKAVYLGGDDDNDLFFTVGKIHDFADGKVIDDENDLRPCNCDMSQQFGVTHDLRSWHFLPIIE